MDPTHGRLPGGGDPPGTLQENRRLAALLRARGDVLATASHELRTPLNAIVGFTELLHDGKLGPVTPEQKESLADVLSSARQLQRLLNDVLDMARIDVGRMEFHADVVPVAAAVREVRELLRGSATRKRIRVELDLPGDAERVTLDRRSLLQVLYGFLAYAIRETPPDGKVSLCLRLDERGVVHLTVCDGGRPLGDDRREHLFDGFLAPLSPEEDREGRGFGLALARQLVEAQGGSVEARRSGEGANELHATVPASLRSNGSNGS
jgi:signal transduction histidine kinase